MLRDVSALRVREAANANAAAIGSNAAAIAAWIALGHDEREYVFRRRRVSGPARGVHW
jgi:hypothetical protein